MLVLLLVAWIGSWFIAGLPLARLALQNEKRRFVLLAFGSVATQATQLVALMLLWQFLPLASSLGCVLAITWLAGAALWWRASGSVSQQHESWGLTRSETAAVVSLVVLFAFLGFRTFTVAYTAGDNEARYWHAGLVSWLGRGLFPPASPLEPDDPLRYRVGLHALAAGVSKVADTSPPEAMAVTLGVLMPLMVLSLVGGALRVFGGPRRGMLASVLGLLGGTFYPYLKLAEGALTGVSPVPIEIINGVLWHGNTLDMLHINPSIAAGFVAFTGAIWLGTEALVSRPTTRWLVLMAAMSVAGLGLTNEVYFAGVVAGIAATALFLAYSRTTSPRRVSYRPLVVLAALISAGCVLVLLRGGLLGGASLTGGGSGSVRLELNVDHFGSVAAPPRTAETRWISLLSPESFFDTDFALLVLPILAVLALHSGAPYLIAAVAASAALWVAWMVVYPGFRPADGYRFGQASLTILICYLPIVLRPVPGFPFPSVPLARRITAWGTAVLITPHLAYAIWLVTLVPAQEFLMPGEPDTLAAEYLSTSVTTHRVLVPNQNPRGGWEDLYFSPSFHSAAASILSLSRHAIPMGHHAGPFNPEAYVPHYVEASTTFDSRALNALKTDWVYVDPSQLSPVQLANLDSSERSGNLRLEHRWGDPGNERLLFRVAASRE